MLHNKFTLLQNVQTIIKTLDLCVVLRNIGMNPSWWAASRFCNGG